jgi:hypothetical protein
VVDRFASHSVTGPPAVLAAVAVVAYVGFLFERNRRRGRNAV